MNFRETNMEMFKKMLKRLEQQNASKPNESDAPSGNRCKHLRRDEDGGTPFCADCGLVFEDEVVYLSEYHNVDYHNPIDHKDAEYHNVDYHNMDYHNPIDHQDAEEHTPTATKPSPAPSPTPTPSPKPKTKPSPTPSPKPTTTPERRSVGSSTVPQCLRRTSAWY